MALLCRKWDFKRQTYFICSEINLPVDVMRHTKILSLCQTFVVHLSIEAGGCQVSVWCSAWLHDNVHDPADRIHHDCVDDDGLQPPAVTRIFMSPELNTLPLLQILDNILSYWDKQWRSYSLVTCCIHSKSSNFTHFCPIFLPIWPTLSLLRRS